MLPSKIVQPREVVPRSVADPAPWGDGILKAAQKAGTTGGGPHADKMRAFRENQFAAVRAGDSSGFCGLAPQETLEPVDVVLAVLHV